MNMPITSKEYGQFFTPKIVADFMVGMSSVSKDSKVLEPSFGKGVFLNELKQMGYINLTGYEIDKSLTLNIDAKLVYESFVSSEIKEKFNLIIGNPPYIRIQELQKWAVKEAALYKKLYKSGESGNFFESKSRSKSV